MQKIVRKVVSGEEPSSSNAGIELSGVFENISASRAFDAGCVEGLRVDGEM
jgi:hypothetical protein